MLLVSVPFGVVTTTGPVVAPLGTTAVMKVSETISKLVAGTPLKVTLVVPVNPWPIGVKSTRKNAERTPWGLIKAVRIGTILAANRGD